MDVSEPGKYPREYARQNMYRISIAGLHGCCAAHQRCGLREGVC